MTNEQKFTWKETFNGDRWICEYTCTVSTLFHGKITGTGSTAHEAQLAAENNVRNIAWATRDQVVDHLDSFAV